MVGNDTGNYKGKVMRRGSNKKLMVDSPTRNATCRLCEEGIPKDTKSYVFQSIHMGGKYHDIFMHIECLDKAIQEVNDEK